MGIVQDAGQILKFVYGRYMDGAEETNTQNLIDQFSEWDSGRLNRAIDYLRDILVLKITLFIGNTDGVYNFVITGLTPFGIQLVESKKQFDHLFNVD